jgi:peptidoglycan/xylan/chitin deacetylase (PgdA/CDA1 family)
MHQYKNLSTVPQSSMPKELETHARAHSMAAKAKADAEAEAEAVERGRARRRRRKCGVGCCGRRCGVEATRDDSDDSDDDDDDDANVNGASCCGWRCSLSHRGWHSGIGFSGGDDDFGFGMGGGGGGGPNVYDAEERARRCQVVNLFLAIVCAVAVLVSVVVYVSGAAAQPPGTVVHGCITTSADVALTFSNGPYDVQTAHALDYLRARAIPASFFIASERAVSVRGRELVRRMREDMHTVGSQGARSDADLTALRRDAWEHNLAAAEEVLGVPRLFRPPFERGTRDIEAYVGAVCDGTTVYSRLRPQHDAGYKRTQAAHVADDTPCAEATPCNIVAVDLYDTADTAALQATLDDVAQYYARYHFVTLDQCLGSGR